MEQVAYFLVAATLLFAGCNKPEKAQPKPIQQEEIIEAEEPDTINEPVFTEEQILAPATSTASNNNKYFLISASFSDYANAKKYQQTLVNQGFSSEIITRKDGANGQFYKVSYMSFNNYNEAVQKLNQEKVAPEKEGIWLLVKN
jgi:cell division protein FtsN